MEYEGLGKKAVISMWRSGIKEDDRAYTLDGVDLAKHEEFGKLESGFLFDAVGLSVFSHNLADDRRMKFLKARQNAAPNDKFKLAILEGKVTYTTESSGTEPYYWDTEGDGVRQGAMRQNKNVPSKFKELKDIFLLQLQAAIDGGADVILAGEFGCPSSEDAAENNSFMDEIRDIIRNVDRPLFLVAGSRHTPSAPKRPSPYNANVAMLFGGDPDHPDFEESLADQPIKHFKRSPSISLMERIFSPESEVLPVYMTPFCNFGMLICSDAFDTQILFSFLRQNSVRHHRAQVILIPSFNKSDLFYDACRYLSYLANATVIVLNSYSKPRFPEPALRVFTAGFDMNEFSDCIDKKRQSEFEDFTDDQVDQLIESVKQNGMTPVVHSDLERCVAFYDIDRVMLESFSERLARSGGPLLKRALRLEEREP